jgi:23S rRNA pseudouridine2605 synthase
MPKERLQKVLAAAGLASRRECEQIILDGRVRVNGKAISSLPVLVDAARDTIVVDGKPLKREAKVYLLLHKPAGVHCTNYDPDGRPRAVDLLVGVKERLFPVGRLDADSTGLLLMTNDGELAERLAHPRYGVPKTYRAHVAGAVTPEDIARLRKGVWLAEGKTHVADTRIIHRGRERSVIEITLQEGRNREVRRVLARLGHNVRRLMRIRIGPLSLRGLPPGGFRPLTPEELRALREGARRRSGSPGGPPGAGKRPFTSRGARHGGVMQGRRKGGGDPHAKPQSR